MGGGRRVAHDRAPAEEARRRRAARLPRPLRPAAHRRRASSSCDFYQARRRQPRRCAICASAARRSAAACRARRRERRADRRCRRSRSYAQFALDADGKEMSTTMAAVRLLEQPAQGQGARPAHRADRRRRGAHLRHGEPVPPDRHLRAAGPALRARGCRLDAVLPRGARRPAARGGHHRGGRARRPGPPPPRRTACTACRCCRSTSTTRCSASSASATSSGPRPTSARAASCSAPPPAARRSAAKGLQHQDGTQPRRRRDRAELPRLRSGVRRRARGDPRPRHAADARAAGGRLLLRHGDERELRAAVAARRREPTTSCAACTASRAHGDAARRSVRLLGSGAILREVIAAAELLREDWRRRRARSAA